MTELARWAKYRKDEVLKSKVTNLYKKFELYMTGRMSDVMFFVATGANKTAFYLVHEKKLTQEQISAVESVLKLRMYTVDQNIKLLG